MWDARCSANFILPEQVSLKKNYKAAALNPGAPVLLLLRRDFLFCRATCWLAAEASLHFRLVPLCAQHVPHTLSAAGASGEQVVGGKSVRVSQRLCSVPPWAVVGTLGSAMQRTTLTWLRQQSAQWHPAARAAGTSCCWLGLHAPCPSTCFSPRLKSQILRSTWSLQIKTGKVLLQIYLRIIICVAMFLFLSANNIHVQQTGCLM